MAETSKPPATDRAELDVNSSSRRAHLHFDPSKGEIVEARVRRSPRYSRFLVVGAVIGVVVAAILAFGVERVDMPQVGEAVFSDGQVFGFLSLIGIATGLLLGGTVALILDRIVGRTTRTVRVDHETTQTPPR